MITLPRLTAEEVTETVMIGDSLLCIKYDCEYTTVGKKYKVMKYFDVTYDEYDEIPENGIHGYLIFDDEEIPDNMLGVEIDEISLDCIYYPVSRIPDEDMFVISLGMGVKVAC